jgi:hypothetical protein
MRFVALWIWLARFPAARIAAVRAGRADEEREAAGSAVRGRRVWIWAED